MEVAGWARLVTAILLFSHGAFCGAASLVCGLFWMRGICLSGLRVLSSEPFAPPLPFPSLPLDPP